MQTNIQAHTQDMYTAGQRHIHMTTYLVEVQALREDLKEAGF